ncbi:MAG: substrate-binding domain-containing protein [Candidatus Elarobacter sp.]
MTTGVCRNPECSNGKDAIPVERYPGPGEYCPECGNLLDEAPPEPAAVLPPTPEPVAVAAPLPEPAAATPSREPVATAAHAPEAAAGGTPPGATPEPPLRRLSSLEELQRLENTLPPPEPAPAPGRPNRRNLIVAAGVVAAIIAAVAVIRPMAIGGPGGTIHVCRSSMTERFALDVIRAYAEQTRTPASRFEMATTGCDVRFATVRANSADGLIGHDGVVVVVNPQNPLTQLSEQQLRMVFTGEIKDWSELGEPPGRIVPILPADSSDESQALMAGMLRGRQLAQYERRVPTSADVVRTVTSGRGRGSIGLVAFSAAVPGKVVRLSALPVPSVLSIGDYRYPLTLALTVAPESTSRDTSLAALVQFARSDSAQAIAMRDGIIPRKGF